MLADDVESLCREFEEPAHRNIDFVGERLRILIQAGHGMANIETALRARAAPIFLVGLPWVAEQHVGYELFHPDPSIERAGLDYFLWIGINGPGEVAKVLADASLSPEMNLVNLKSSGFITKSDGKSPLPSNPTLREFVKWLLLDARSWTARRDAIVQHQELLTNGEETLRDLRKLAEHKDLKPSSRALFSDMAELLSHVAHDGPQSAFQNCRLLVLEALLSFLEAATWPAASRIYAVYQNELGGDLALEILAGMKADARYTETQRRIIAAHSWTLEIAWEHGIEKAIADAREKFPSKQGESSPEDFLQNYLKAPDPESACRALRIAPRGLFQLVRAVIVSAMRHAASDDLWRVGLLLDAQKRGVDESYREWTELLAITGFTDNQAALRKLTDLREASTDLLRDQVLELLLEFQNRAGNEEAQQAVAQELVNHRSAWSPLSRRPLDLANLGVISSKRGDFKTARAAFKEARSAFDQLLTPLARAQFWLKAGIFSNDYDKDLATALHCFRIAAEEFTAAKDLISVAYAFEEISSIYRSLDRVRLAEVYAILAQRSIAGAGDDQTGVVGSFTDISRSIEKGVALTEFLLEDYESTAERTEYLLNDPSLSAEERLPIERLAIACAIANENWHLARNIANSWSKNGQLDLAVVAGATIALLKDPNVDLECPFDPATSADFNDVGQALRSLGANPLKVERFLLPSTRASLGRALVYTLAQVMRADPFLPIRILGDFEAAIWVTQSERSAAATAQATMQRNRPTPLPPAAPWSEIIARYDLLGVWEIPDLAVIGPILDRWSLLSRFEHAVRINPVPPRDDHLNVYFYRIDPEGHIGLNTCAYIPEGDLIICSLRYLDDLSGLRRNQWHEEFDIIKSGLVGDDWENPEEVAQSLVDKLRARERVLLEWVIAHEIGHAHFSLSKEPPGSAHAVEEQADSFFIDGMAREEDVGEILHAIYGQLNMLYWYDCERQTKRAIPEDERRDRSVKLNPAADATGHRPLTLRAVELIRSILKTHPELGSDAYIEQFAASIVAH